MKTAPLLACLVLLAGCLGYPEGSVHPGDRVTLVYSALDPATGQELAGNSTLVAVAGQPARPGAGLDLSILGRELNEVFTVDARAAYPGTQEVPTSLGRLPLESVAPRAAFEAQIGPAVVGESFRASALYNATVVAVDGANVTYRVDVADGLEIPVPELGLKIVHRVAGSDVVRTLGPLPGATFSLQPNREGQTPLGLPPGSYRTRGAEGERLVFDYSPVGPAFVDQVVRYRFQVVAVRPPSPGGDGDGYGHRFSPQLLGDPDASLGNLTAFG